LYHLQYRTGVDATFAAEPVDGLIIGVSRKGLPASQSVNQSVNRRDDCREAPRLEDINTHTGGGRRRAHLQCVLSDNVARQQLVRQCLLFGGARRFELDSIKPFEPIEAALGQSSGGKLLDSSVKVESVCFRCRFRQAVSAAPSTLLTSRASAAVRRGERRVSRGGAT
jgi:hypothetical protein